MDVERDRQFELKLDAGRPLPEVIADKVRELIDSGFYKPGGRLDNESELARNMKVARSSVRTALQRLETQHVLEVKRGLGWYVRRSPPSGSSPAPSLLEGRNYRISDLFELRIGLEGLAVSLAAARASEGEIDDIAKFNQQHHDAGADQDELLRTDEAFHGAIVQASRNDLLIATYTPIVAELSDWRYRSYAARGVPVRSAREHGKIVRFLRNGDAGGARFAMNSHLQSLYDELEEIGDEPLDLLDHRLDPEPEWRKKVQSEG